MWEEFENKKYKLAKDPKGEGCINCVVYLMFGETTEGEDCKQFAKGRNLSRDCDGTPEVSMIYVEDLGEEK